MLRFFPGLIQKRRANLCLNGACEVRKNCVRIALRRRPEPSCRSRAITPSGTAVVVVVVVVADQAFLTTWVWLRRPS